MSKREELRVKRQKAARQQQLLLIGAVAVGVLVVGGLLVWPSIVANVQPAGTVVAPSAEDFPQADGKNLGPKDAKAVVQEFSDFK